MSLQKKIITILLASLFLNAYSQNKQNWISEIDSLVNTKNPLNFNGVILITKNGKTLYLKAVGVNNSEKNAPSNLIPPQFPDTRRYCEISPYNAWL